MTTPSFASVLDRPSDSIERPRPLPVGTYLWATKDQPKQDKAKTGTEYVEFTCIPLQAGEDVDAEALQECLTNKATGEVKPLGSKTRRLTFYLTEDSIYRLNDFLTHLGVEAGSTTLRQRLSMSPGCQFLGSVIHKPSQDGTAIFDNIGNTAPVEA